MIIRDVDLLDFLGSSSYKDPKDDEPQFLEKITKDNFRFLVYLDDNIPFDKVVAHNSAATRVKSNVAWQIQCTSLQEQEQKGRLSVTIGSAAVLRSPIVSVF